MKAAATDSTYKPLRGQKALVTGASSGIGRAVAIALAQAGADVGVNWASGEDKAKAVVREIEALGVRAFPVGADVGDEAQVLAMFERARSEFGTLHVLINNAGLQKDASLTNMTSPDFRRLIDVNLLGQFLCSREAVREFRRRGPDEAVSVALGKIVCMSSVHDTIPWAGHVNYAASKGGVSMLMKSIAQEVAPERIRVNAISPGAIRTPINKEAWSTPAAYEKLMKLVPYKRIGEPEDIGRAAVWLASDESDYVTGTTLYVDGGMTLYPGFEAGG
jgi:glucose 1-dehydrogenase